MPRLRHYKNFEQIGESKDEREQDFNDGTDGEIKQPRGWYSTSNIITGLSDKQIETNIQFHKTQIRLMEEELLNRALGLRVYIPYIVPDFGVPSEEGNENTRQNFKKNSTVKYHMKQLLPVLKSIRKKHGMNAFVYCRDGWLSLLEDFYDSEDGRI